MYLKIGNQLITIKYHINTYHFFTPIFSLFFASIILWAMTYNKHIFIFITSREINHSRIFHFRNCVNSELNFSFWIFHNFRKNYRVQIHFKKNWKNSLKKKYFDNSIIVKTINSLAETWNLHKLFISVINIICT